jgi:hypothetical protein
MVDRRGGAAASTDLAQQRLDLVEEGLHLDLLARLDADFAKLVAGPR